MVETLNSSGEGLDDALEASLEKTMSKLRPRE